MVIFMNIKIVKNIDFKCSFMWIKQAFYVFREQPLQFICLGLIATILSFVPIIGAFFMPIFTARFALIANTIESKQIFKFSDILKGLFTNKEILKLALISFSISIVFYLIQYVIEMYFSNANDQFIEYVTIMIVMTPLVLFQLSMWLSPILCLFNKELSALEAMTLSFKSSIFNVLLLFCYAIMIFIFTLLAIMPIGLGLIIWLPILNISTYYVYRSMFEL